MYSQKSQILSMEPGNQGFQKNSQQCNGQTWYTCSMMVRQSQCCIEWTCTEPQRPCEVVLYIEMSRRTQGRPKARWDEKRDKTKLSQSRAFSLCSAVLVVDSMEWDEALEVVQGGLMCWNIPQKAGQTKSELRRKARRVETRTTVITLMTGNKVDRIPYMLTRLKISWY